LHPCRIRILLNKRCADEGSDDTLTIATGMGEHIAHEVHAGVVEEVAYRSMLCSDRPWRRAIGAQTRSANYQAAPANDPLQNKDKESGSEPLQVDSRGRQIGLDLHIGEATPHCARKAVPGLSLAVEAF
jgi:hypothetical protein